MQLAFGRWTARCQRGKIFIGSGRYIDRKERKGQGKGEIEEWGIQCANY